MGCIVSTVSVEAFKANKEEQEDGNAAKPKAKNVGKSSITPQGNKKKDPEGRVSDASSPAATDQQSPATTASSTSKAPRASAVQIDDEGEANVAPLTPRKLAEMEKWLESLPPPAQAPKPEGFEKLSGGQNSRDGAGAENERSPNCLPTQNPVPLSSPVPPQHTHLSLPTHPCASQNCTSQCLLAQDIHTPLCLPTRQPPLRHLPGRGHSLSQGMVR